MIPVADCPRGVALKDIPVDECFESFLKDAKPLFQRRDIVNNIFDDTLNNINLKASWDAFLNVANTANKITVCTEAKGGLQDENARLDKGENADGSPVLSSMGPVRFEYMFDSIPREVYNALKDYENERNLTFYRVDSAGKIMANEQSTGVYTGFPISPGTFAVYSPNRGNTLADVITDCKVEFYLADGWYSTHKVIVPTDFNGRFDLQPVP